MSQDSAPNRKRLGVAGRLRSARGGGPISRRASPFGPVTIKDLAADWSFSPVVDPDADVRDSASKPRRVCRVIGCGTKYPLHGVCGYCRAKVIKVRLAGGDPAAA